MKLFDFLLNKGSEAKRTQAVEAPAFSITKILGVTAVIIAPITTVIVDKIGTLDMSAWQYVTLALGVLAFMAVLAAADVLARAYATGQVARGRAYATGEAAKETAARAGAAHLLRFEKPLRAHVRGKGDEHVDVVAAAEWDEPYFLVVPKQNGRAPKWEPASTITME